jgi:hypothetical protein
MTNKVKILLIALAILTSAHADAEPTNVSKLFNLLGQDIRDKDAQEYLGSLNAKPEITQQNFVLKCTYYNYKDFGFSIVFNKHGTVISLLLFAEGSENNRQFQGLLPYGIRFSMTREQVEKKLGPASAVGFAKGDGLSWAKYASKNLLIDYIADSESDMRARISVVEMQPKE